MTSTAPRIAPAVPPYPPDVDEALRAMMPRAAAIEPLRLFRTLVRNLPLATGMRAVGSHLLGRGRALETRDREIVIARTCARCACEYEWGVHVVAFGPGAGLTPAEIEATVTGAPVWTPRDAVLVRLVDELHDTGTVSDDLWTGLAAHWNDAQLVELLLLVGWYHAISYVANGARVEAEPWAARFPAAR
jgi:4-carboxymuconolactone decarboxylase